MATEIQIIPSSGRECAIIIISIGTSDTKSVVYIFIPIYGSAQDDISSILDMIDEVPVFYIARLDDIFSLHSFRSDIVSLDKNSGVIPFGKLFFF